MNDIEQQLATLTEWTGGATSLWQKADPRKAGVAARLFPNLGRPVSNKFLVVSGIAAVLMIAVFTNIPHVGTTVRSERADRKAVPAERSLNGDYINIRARATGTVSPSDESGMPIPVSSTGVVESYSVSTPEERDYSSIQIVPEDGDRAKALDTVLKGVGSPSQFDSASTTVARYPVQSTRRADRLDDVLNELRKIGKVASEELGGRDVTTEVVDVDARLRNEQRVEVELLELLESRKDAPLTELMQLRESLKNVRYSIESLAGRRETLSRMVSLATLLVIIRTDAKSPAPVADSFWSYFGREMDTAWTAAIRFLADATATIVRILVGGLPFWIGLVVLMVFLRKRKA
jgi:hypothetical protein